MIGWKHVLDAGERAPRLATAPLEGAGPFDVGSALEWGAGSFFPDQARCTLLRRPRIQVQFC